MSYQKINFPGLLRLQVYEYLREKLNRGELKPKMIIRISEICKAVNMSTSPVRDALIHLQAEGFITLLPQRGVQINELSVRDVTELYEILAGIESHILRSVFERLGKGKLSKMKKINEAMQAEHAKNDYQKYYLQNIAFHDVFMSLSENRHLLEYISILKERLFAFTKQDWIVQWQESNYHEHLRLVELIEKKDREGAANYLRDVHWKYHSSADRSAAIR